MFVNEITKAYFKIRKVTCTNNSFKALQFAFDFYKGASHTNKKKLLFFTNFNF